jgi:hypothetical protein
MPRDYKHEDAIETPQRKAQRAERKRAERAWVKQHGPIPAGKQVDHRQPLSGGGSNTMSNLRLISTHTNESYDRAGPGGKQLGPAGGKKK